MVVKIQFIESLSNLGSNLSQYSSTVREATSGVKKSFQVKVEGSQAEAIQSYVGVISELGTTIFTGFPTHINQFSNALNNYHAELNALKFPSNIVSDAATVVDYAANLKGKQVTSIRDIAVDIAAAINDAATIVEDIETSKITSDYLPTFETKMKADGEKIKTIHEKAIDAKNTFMDSLNQVIADLKSDQNALNQVMTMTNPKTGLSPKQLIKFVKDGHLTGDNMAQMLRNMTKPDDVRAFKALVENDYDAFFKLNPDNLSDGSYALALQKIVQMLGQENLKQFEGLLESLLNCGNDKNRGQHLNRLSLNSDYMAMQSIDLYLQNETNLTDAEKARLENLVNDFQNLSTLWLALQAMDLSSTRGTKNPHIEDFKKKFDITDLKRGKDGSISFDLTEKMTTSKGHKVSDTTHTTSVSTAQNGQEMTDKGLTQKMQQLQQEQRDKMKNFLLNQAGSVGGIFIPGFKDGLQIITDLPSLADSIKNGVSHTTGKGNSDTQAIGTVGNNAIDALTFWDDMKRIQEQIDNISNEKLNNLVDTGGKIIENDGKITVNGGMPTIDSTRKYNEIANNGFKNYVAQAPKNEEEKEKINQMFQEPLSPEQNFILNGNGNIDDMDFTKIMNILDKIKNKTNSSVFDWIKNIK
ncbi:hypothetical protein BCR24_14840 [Enterococcus ureilyticus]|uniref:Uncharacterized protein n=1 Tax=Enterococcus ureilyticus TaxID=1131292 RepID=A0A1E5HC88_9ENTE|nr:hypothetical protein [Enterococcus ureilyticus]MBM7690351.1 hypothetical protein [Enterococcus ureilyticus]OEG22554.1 hypothetical protein BCR24_14840 [Enterococcus ureilyticus]